MQLRHIEPGSLEWKDATEGARATDLAELDPDEVQKLRVLAASEGMAPMPAPLAPPTGPARATRAR